MKKHVGRLILLFGFIMLIIAVTIIMRQTFWRAEPEQAPTAPVVSPVSL